MSNQCTTIIHPGTEPRGKRCVLRAGHKGPHSTNEARKPKTKPYWLKERHNPQLGVYWVKEGQCGVREAKRMERTLYGTNIMHRFGTEAEYNAKIEALQKEGARIQ
jgi:hypothetical protein